MRPEQLRGFYRWVRGGREDDPKVISTGSVTIQPVEMTVDATVAPASFGAAVAVSPAAIEATVTIEAEPT